MPVEIPEKRGIVKHLRKLKKSFLFSIVYGTITFAPKLRDCLGSSVGRATD